MKSTWSTWYPSHTNKNKLIKQKENKKKPLKWNQENRNIFF